MACSTKLATALAACRSAASNMMARKLSGFGSLTKYRSMKSVTQQSAHEQPSTDNLHFGGKFVD
jgi:hypothetical protein